jgi:Bacterial PH domain
VTPMTAGSSGQQQRVTARPIRSARIATVCAAAVFLVLLIVAILLPHTTDGVNFTVADQVGMAGLGLLFAVGILRFTRPAMWADASGVHSRGFIGGYHVVEWDLVRAVEFPPKVRFARLVLPGDELIPLYAVQRGDGERSVAVMDALRAMFAEYGMP